MVSNLITVFDSAMEVERMEEKKKKGKVIEATHFLNFSERAGGVGGKKGEKEKTVLIPL